MIQTFITRKEGENKTLGEKAGSTPSATKIQGLGRKKKLPPR